MQPAVPLELNALDLRVEEAVRCVESLLARELLANLVVISALLQVAETRNVGRDAARKRLVACCELHVDAHHFEPALKQLIVLGLRGLALALAQGRRLVCCRHAERRAAPAAQRSAFSCHGVISALLFLVHDAPVDAFLAQRVKGLALCAPLWTYQPLVDLLGHNQSKEVLVELFQQRSKDVRLRRALDDR